MKAVIMRRLFIAGIALLTVPSVFAQKEKEYKEKSDKKEVQTIVITRSGDKEDKVTVEVKGDKVTVNGKDVKDYKDGDVKVRSYSGSHGMAMNGPAGAQSFVWKDGNAMSLFSEDENRAMLGVTTEGNDKGAEIESVTKESAAEKAGLKKGDIITKIGDRKIESTDDVTEAVRAHKPGDKVTITYVRDGKTQTANAELMKWKGVRMATISGPMNFTPMPDLNQRFKEIMPMEGYAYGVGRPRLGLSIQDTEDGLGVKVLDVDDESAAAKAGIKEGDILIGVDDTDIKGTEDVLRATRASKDKTSYKFKVKRGNSTQNIEVKIPRKLKTADL
jgi:serine protease Do